MTRRVLLPVVLCTLVVALPRTSLSHWCSNIWKAPARLVVKPEKSTVEFCGSSPAQLRVYVRNNFPLRVPNLRMRGSAAGYTVTVSPASRTVLPGQQTSFLFTIAGGSGTFSVTDLTLEVRFNVNSFDSGWETDSDCIPNQNVADSTLRSATQWGTNSTCSADQAGALGAAAMADLKPALQLGSGAPTFGRTGWQELIHLFGYRFCYGAGGDWRCGSSNCGPFPPSSSCAEGSAWDAIDQFPQNCMRAGAHIGANKARLGSHLDAARAAAVNALKPGSGSNSLKGSGEHKCLAAVVGGLLFNGASSTSEFEAALSASANAVPQVCQQAGLRAMGQGAASTCGQGAAFERAACAAAEGLRGNYGPVNSVLVTGVGSSDYEKLYRGYMLHVVAGHLRGNTGDGAVPFYEDAGAPVVGTCADSGVMIPPDVAPPPPPPPQDGSGPWPDGSGPIIPGTDATMPAPGTEAGLPAPGTEAGLPADDGAHLEGGCGCALDAAGAPAGLAWLALLGLLLWLRRRG